VDFESNGNTDGISAPLLPPPLLGEHTRDILTNLLQYDDLRIDELVQQKVVQCYDRKTS